MTAHPPIDDRDPTHSIDWESIRRAVLERDRHQCQNCGAEETHATLDVHHIVPRGQGGSHRFGNLVTLCRRCHRAAHGEVMAPTVQSESTGEMSPATFEQYRQFWTEVFPAMGRAFGVRVEPIFDDETKSWHVPEADMRALYEAVDEEAEGQLPIEAADFM